jgi:hypothetical protein
MSTADAAAVPLVPALNEVSTAVKRSLSLPMSQGCLASPGQESAAHATPVPTAPQQGTHVPCGRSAFSNSTHEPSRAGPSIEEKLASSPESSRFPLGHGKPAITPGPTVAHAECAHGSARRVQGMIAASAKQPGHAKSVTASQPSGSTVEQTRPAMPGRSMCAMDESLSSRSGGLLHTEHGCHLVSGSGCGQCQLVDGECVTSGFQHKGKPIDSEPAGGAGQQGIDHDPDRNSKLVKMPCGDLPRPLLAHSIVHLDEPSAPVPARARSAMAVVCGTTSASSSEMVAEHFCAKHGQSAVVKNAAKQLEKAGKGSTGFHEKHADHSEPRQPSDSSTQLPVPSSTDEHDAPVSHQQAGTKLESAGFPSARTGVIPGYNVPA